MSAEGLRLPPGYERRLSPEPSDEFAETRPDWTRTVYALAAQAARDAGATMLVDLGCGTGRRLLACAGELDPVGIDLEPTISRCRERHATGTWTAHDRVAGSPLPSVEDPLGAAYVCIEVIEHLTHPDRLLAKLRAALAPGMPAVISTPDRDRAHGAGHLGPPPNPQHAQEWTLSEFALLLADAGFPNAELRHIGDPDPRTILAIL